MIHPEEIRKEFPILDQKVNGKDLIYFDNGATSQTPNLVVDAISSYYKTINSNVHRGIHSLSQKATDEMEIARKKIQDFIGAASGKEIIFNAGTTDGINTVAFGLRKYIQKNDEILITEMEHHANIVPWQMLCEMTGAILKVIPFSANNGLDLKAFKNLLSSKTKILAVTYISNTLGIVNPVKEMIDLAHSYNAKVLLDAAQAIPHKKIDVSILNPDYMVFSLHKMYGPTGVGILYGKETALSVLEPYRGGGAMINEVTFERTTYNELPFRLEAGTPNIAGNIASGYAIDFINSIGIEKIESYELELIDYAKNELKKLKEVEVYALNQETTGAISFNLKFSHVHASDIGHILNMQGIAVRTGHHCTQPIMNKLCVPATARISFAVYNTKEEIDLFITALKKAIQMLA